MKKKPAELNYKKKNNLVLFVFKMFNENNKLIIRVSIAVVPPRASDGLRLPLSHHPGVLRFLPLHRRIRYVAGIFDDFGHGEPPLQHLGGEVVAVSELLKPNQEALVKHILSRK